MDLFTEFELLIMISIISGLLLLIIILSICEFLSRRKERQIEEFTNLEDSLEELEITRKFMAFKDIDEKLELEKEKIQEEIVETGKEEILIEEVEEL